MRRLPLSALLTVALGATAGCLPTADGDGGPPPSAMDSSVVEVDGLSPDLVCPGARGCDVGGGDVLAGVGARTITPIVEPWEDLDEDGKWDPGEPFEDLNGNEALDHVWIAGFSMGRAATGVHDDNWARAIVLEKGDVRVGLVALDVVGYFHPDVIKIRVAAADAGLDLDHVLVASTHQHEGKDTMGLWGADPSSTGYDPDYIDLIVRASIGALEDAQAGLQRASVRAAQTDAPHLVADSREPQVIDPTITGLQFVDDEGAPFIDLVLWGNHPEALGGDNTLITSDYPHYLRERLESTFPGSTAVFFAGALGGLMNPLGRVTGCPDAMDNDTCPVGTFERAAYIGEGVADLIADAWQQGATEEDPAAAELSFRRKTFLIRGTNQAFFLAFKLGLVSRHAYLLEDRTRIEAARMLELSVEELIELLGLGTEVGALRVGPVEIATVPGELYPELWLVGDDGSVFIEQPEGADFPDAPLETPLQATMAAHSAAPMVALINNANDALGYIIPKPQFDFTGERAYDEDGQYGEQNSVGEDAAPTITGAVIDMYSLAP
jgi:hypothetical protein